MGSKTRILERKLDALELELGVHNAGTGAGDFEQRCAFLDKILAAEITSRPGNSDQFHEIAYRIAAVRAAFRDRNDINAASSYHEDSVSVCSDCLHNLQNDGAKELSSPNSSVEESADAAEEKRPRGRRFEKYCAVFSCGVMIGAFLGVQLLSPIYDQFSVFPDASLLLPPT